MMDVERVKDIIRDSLGLEENVVIEDEVPLSVFEAGKVDLADVLFKLNAYDVRDFSSGEFNEQGRNVLREVGKFSRDPSYFFRFALMFFSDSDEIFESLTPMDICHIVNYKHRVAT